jgi:uncharacterized membrane protein
MALRWRLSQVGNAVIVLVVLVSMTTQLVLVVRGVDVLVEDDGTVASTPMRVVRFFSYFTIQSNLLAMVTAATIVLRPDRDGRWWRIARVAALVGMTVTFFVYYIALRPILDLHGVAKATDIAFHYVAPLMTVGGWMLFGPRPRIDPGSLVRHLVWPVAYLAYILVFGAITEWYPYPFIDADDLGYATALFHALLVTALLLGVGGAYWYLDKALSEFPKPSLRTEILSAG